MPQNIVLLNTYSCYPCKHWRKSQRTDFSSYDRHEPMVFSIDKLHVPTVKFMLNLHICTLVLWFHSQALNNCTTDCLLRNVSIHSAFITWRARKVGVNMQSHEEENNHSEGLFTLIPWFWESVALPLGTVFLCLHSMTLHLIFSLVSWCIPRTYFWSSGLWLSPSISYRGTWSKPAGYLVFGPDLCPGLEYLLHRMWSPRGGS